jgi:hypothetical protein
MPNTRDRKSTLKLREIPGAMVDNVYTIFWPHHMYGTIDATATKVRTEPATDQNSLKFGLFFVREMRIVVIRTIRMGIRGFALSMIIMLILHLLYFMAINMPESLKD